MRTQPPFYRKIGGLHFFRLGRLQVSFCLCRATVTRKVTWRRSVIAAQRTIDIGIPRIVQHQFGPFA